MTRLATLLLCTLLAACASTTTGGPPVAGSTAFTLWTPGLKDNAVLDARYSGNLEPNALPPGLTLAELLARLEGGRAKVAASTVLRFGR